MAANTEDYSSTPSLFPKQTKTILVRHTAGHLIVGYLQGRGDNKMYPKMDQRWINFLPVWREWVTVKTSFTSHLKVIELYLMTEQKRKVFHGRYTFLLARRIIDQNLRMIPQVPDDRDNGPIKSKRAVITTSTVYQEA